VFAAVPPALLESTLALYVLPELLPLARDSVETLFARLTDGHGLHPGLPAARLRAAITLGKCARAAGLLPPQLDFVPEEEEAKGPSSGGEGDGGRSAEGQQSPRQQFTFYTWPHLMVPVALMDGGLLEHTHRAPRSCLHLQGVRPRMPVAFAT